MGHPYDKNYIKIDNTLLFQLNPLLHCTYAVWIYLYLRLKYNLTEQQYDLSWRVDVDEIAEFFNINRSTVFEALKILEKTSLVIRQERGFYSIDGEADLAYVIRKSCESDGRRFPDNLLLIYNEFFLSFFNHGGLPKELGVYYYLIDQNQHFAVNQDYLKVNVSQKQVCDIFRIDHRTYKRCIENLIRHELIVKDGNGGLLTKSPNPEFTGESLYKESTTIGTDTTSENVVHSHTMIN
jgi:hypothetical protein